MWVLVARPHPGAARTAERLRELGHEPVLAPVIRICSRPVTPPAERIDALLLTSAQAAPALSAFDRSLPVFAVGSRTAEAAAAAGFDDVRTGDADAAALAGVVGRALPSGACLLHLAGQDRKPEPEASLRRAGYRVLVAEAYAALAEERLPEAGHAALAEGRIEAALHYSRRSAAILRRLAEAEGLGAALARLDHLCLSADVAKPLAGLRVREADAPTEEALLALLAPVRGLGR